MSKLKVGKSYFFLGNVHQAFVLWSGGAVALPLHDEFAIFSVVCARMCRSGMYHSGAM